MFLQRPVIFCVCVCLYSPHLSGCAVISHLVLMCTVLMVGDVGCLLMCLLVICTALQKCLSESFAVFESGCLGFLLLSFRSSLYIQGINSLSHKLLLLCSPHKMKSKSSGLEFRTYLPPISSTLKSTWS